MRKQMILGFIATAVIAIALPMYASRESNRMQEAKLDLRAEALTAAMPLYAENCVVCHGATGEGVGAFPSMDSEALRAMDYDALFKSIERGRYDTAMAPYGVDEGGILSDARIDQLVALIYYGDWGETGAVVTEMGLIPPLPAAATVSTATLQLVAELPGGEALARGLTLYGENCVACHGDGGETTLAPAVNSEDMRARLSDDDLARIIDQGVPGTLMAGWDNVLNESDVADLATTLRRWDELPTDAVPAPTAPPVIAVSDPDVIAWGGQIYNVACAQCHGAEGQGRPNAPALNVQGYLSDTNDLALKIIISQGVPETSMPSWADRLSDKELNALVSFVRAWEPTAPAMAEMERGRPTGKGRDRQTEQGGGQGGPPWLREGAAVGSEGDARQPAGDAPEGAGLGQDAEMQQTEGAQGRGRDEAKTAASTDVLTETNWRPLLFFGIAGVALAALLLVLSRSDER